jgi:hypothetical protein
MIIELHLTKSSIGEMLCVGRATIKGGVEWIIGFSIPAAVVVHDGSWKRQG